MNPPPLAETYRAEALELLDELEAGLLELESAPTDNELINRIFRALHTIKGSGKMCGFHEIAAFTHDIETAYDQVREGRLAVEPELISQTLAACDCIRRMVHQEAVDAREVERLMEHFRAFQGKPSRPATEPPAGQTSGQRLAEAATIYRIRFKPCRDILRSGTSILPLLDELRGLGECTVICHTTEVPEFAELDPESCYLSWDIVLTTSRKESDIREVFIFVEDECELEITLLESAGDPERMSPPKRIGELLVEKGDMPLQSLTEVLASRPLFGEELVNRKLVPPSNVEAVLAEQQHVKKLIKEQQQTAVATSVRVAAEKLDTLVNLVGELVIVQARLTQHSSTSQDGIAVGIAEEIERLTAELRDNTMGLRMLPIGTLFSKFKRTVRDLAKQLGKQVELVMEGGETELDKTVIEQLSDPLMHIIRNCVDHGIELPGERQACGKDQTGIVRLAARHAGANVVISITDDGAGLDAARIRAKAVEKGLIAADAVLADSDIHALVFEPGFSTAAVVSDVSGRGVGMDVVKRGVDALRGAIEVESAKGRGTSISIRLPLTLAIIDGLLVETGGDKHVIPQAAVIECLEQTSEDIAKAHGNYTINVRGDMVPYLCLRNRFGIEGSIPPVRRVVLCEANEKRVGLAVDRVIGNYQTVIKPLGDVYKKVECISGATILGDGTVALILDPVKLLAEDRGRATAEKKTVRV